MPLEIRQALSQPAVADGFRGEHDGPGGVRVAPVRLQRLLNPRGADAIFLAHGAAMHPADGEAIVDRGHRRREPQQTAEGEGYRRQYEERNRLMGVVFASRSWRIAQWLRRFLGRM